MDTFTVGQAIAFILAMTGFYLAFRHIEGRYKRDVAEIPERIELYRKVFEVERQAREEKCALSPDDLAAIKGE